MLSEYGLDLNIETKSRRFFRQEKVLNKSIKGDVNLFSVEGVTQKDIFYITSTIKPMKLHVEVNFTYGINEGIYLNDLK